MLWALPDVWNNVTKKKNTYMLHIIGYILIVTLVTCSISVVFFPFFSYLIFPFLIFFLPFSPLSCSFPPMFSLLFSFSPLLISLFPFSFPLFSSFFLLSFSLFYFPPSFFLHHQNRQQLRYKNIIINHTNVFLYKELIELDPYWILVENRKSP